MPFQDYLLFIASGKRLPVSVAVQIILPTKCRIADFRHKPAKFNNYTILFRKRIFRPAEGGQMKQKIESTRSYSFY